MSSYEQLLDKAQYWADRLGRIKSVEAIFLSGSLAQGQGDENSDIDFFILAKPGQIWTARFKVFTQLKRHKQLAKPHDHAGKICPNHFITTDNLEIAEKDAYSAHLFSHNIPLYDPQGYFFHFAQANSWVEEYGEAFKKKNLKTKKLKKLEKKNISAFGFLSFSAFCEALLRTIQTKKIKSNPEYNSPGAQIILTDAELRFHPVPRNKEWTHISTQGDQ